MGSTVTQKPGSLTIIGSGIESIGHITLQALSHIESAAKVFYCVVDPATEAFILNKNKNCVDLYRYYDNGKPRMETYTQMAEVMLREVRNGLDVVGAFYGHPGVFVSPSHRAIAIAKSEGYHAKMLPGVSAEDCLFADLGIDPCNPGCLSYEASDLVLRERQANTSSHLILWQVGCIGISDFNFNGFDNSGFEVLVERLEKDYGPEHPVIHYIAAVLPTEDAVVDKWTIGQLHDPQVAQRVTGISTFYIPPKESQRASVEVLRKLRLPLHISETDQPFYPLNQWSALPAKSNKQVVPYDLHDQAALAKLDNHTTPKQYAPLLASKAMIDVMTELALDTRMLAEYKADPHAFARARPDLSEKERNALEKGTMWAIQAVMRDLSALDKKGEEDGRPNSAVIGLIFVALVAVTINDMLGSAVVNA